MALYRGSNFQILPGFWVVRPAVNLREVRPSLAKHVSAVNGAEGIPEVKLEQEFVCSAGAASIRGTQKLSHDYNWILVLGVGLTGKRGIDPASNTRPSESHQNYMHNSLYNTVFQSQLNMSNYLGRGLGFRV